MPTDWLKDKKVSILVRYVPDRPADMSPDVPYAADLLTGPRAENEFLEFLTEPAQLGKPIIANKAGTGQTESNYCKPHLTRP